MSENIDLITDLYFVGVFDRGVPNQERIVYRALAPIAMQGYGLLLGYGEAGARSIVPIRDYFFWFGPGTVDVGSWIFVYTSPGEFRQTTMETGDPAYVFHWGRAQTILADSRLVPILIHIDRGLAGEPPRNVPQQGLLGSTAGS